jgi:phosphate transport system substrate-binding protein
MFLLTALVLSACGPTATVTPTEVTTATDTPTEVTVTTEEPLSGTITVAGSSTVYPLSEAMAERFKNEGFAGDITIASVGSGAGFERFCVAGETDISNASRGIKDSEVESCAAIGRTPIEFRVGTDALAIVVSSTNEFLTDVTLEELGMIFSSRVQSWSDVRAEWPNQPIQRFSPGTDSGTFDYFVEEVIAKVNLNADGKADIEAGKKDILDASNIQFSEDDNVLVVGVEGSQYAIGYFGFAYYIENASRLKAISVDGVAPTAETAENGDYALARPLYIYSDAGILKDKPQVAAFIEFFLTYVNEEIEEVGYFPASEDALNVARQALQDALK